MNVSHNALYKNFMEWVAGPTGYITLHVLAIVLLFLFASQTTKEKTSEIEVQVVEIDPLKLDTLVPQDPRTELPPETVPTVTPPEVSIDMPPPPEISDFAQAPADTLTELYIDNAISPIILRGLPPGAMGNRIGESRIGALGNYAGPWGERAEIAVLRALEWLRIHQNADGSWGNNDKEAYTGLAILTYLAHGETTASEKYGATVERAIRFLVARQNEQGEFLKTEGSGGVYGHAICTYALSEAYGMTRIPSLRQVMEKAVQVILDGQRNHGGWVMYSFGKTGDAARWDVSLSGFCMQALKAAYIAGADNQGLKASMDKASEFLVQRQQQDGSFPYSAANSGRQPNMTAVSVLCLQLLGYGNHSATKSGLSYLKDADCNWKKPEQTPIYSWYYVSQAKFHQGGTHWTAWNNKFAPTLINNQSSDGSWTSPGHALTGDGVTREFRGESINSQVYATTLAALTLQVYYRFLPTYQPIETKAIDQKSAEDVRVEIL